MPFTYQETFDKMVSHLRKQGCKSMATIRDVLSPEITNHICAYRGQNNTQCAIGCLIPDADYALESNWIESNSINSTKVQKLMLSLGYDCIDLLRAMQNVHDAFDTAFWEEHFRMVADRFGLVYTPIV